MVGYGQGLACVVAPDIDGTLGREIEIVCLPVVLKVLAEQFVTDSTLDFCISVYGFDRREPLRIFVVHLI